MTNGLTHSETYGVFILVNNCRVTQVMTLAAVCNRVTIVLFLCRNSLFLQWGTMSLLRFQRRLFWAHSKIGLYYLRNYIPNLLTDWLTDWLAGWLTADWLTYWLTGWLTDSLSPCSWLRFEMVLLSQLAKKLPAFYGARRCITVCARARHLSLSRGRWIQSTLSHPPCLRSILIVSSHLPIGLHSGHLPSGFLPKPCIYFTSDIVRNILVKFGEYLYILQFPIFVPLVSSLLCKKLGRKGAPRMWRLPAADVLFSVWRFPTLSIRLFPEHF
jgi:hypothetical protein